MNLQELNDSQVNIPKKSGSTRLTLYSGRNLRTFFASAIGLTVLTLTCWTLEIQRRRFMKWFLEWKEEASRKRNERYRLYRNGIKYHEIKIARLVFDERPFKKGEWVLTGIFVPNFKDRVQLLCWAICHGHAKWLWNTDAIIPILTADLCGSFKEFPKGHRLGTIPFPKSAVETLHQRAFHDKYKKLQIRYYPPKDWYFNRWDRDPRLTPNTPLERVPPDDKRFGVYSTHESCWKWLFKGKAPRQAPEEE